MRIFLIIWITLVAYSVTAFSEDLDYKADLKKCLMTKEKHLCRTVMAILDGADNYKEALIVSELLCEQDPSDCDQSYYLSKRISKEKSQEIFKKFVQRCKKSPKYCDELKSIKSQFRENKPASH